MTFSDGDALVARRRNQKDAVAYTDPLDFYSTHPGGGGFLADFGHRSFCGLGEWKSWCEFYLTHIKLAFGLASREEQIAWLEDASIQFLLWFGLAAATLRQGRPNVERSARKNTGVSLTPQRARPIHALRP